MLHFHKLRYALSLALALGLGLFATSLAWKVPPAGASGPLDNQASELVRLINGARSASGKSSLTIDVFLASKARDGAIPCPDDSAKTIAGRARDMAATGSMSHNLRNCDSATTSSKTFVSTLQSAWGYGSVGEILLDNGGYGNGAYLYSVAGSKRTWMTWTYSTTGHAMTGWKSSSSHWAIVMGGYSHVGCGGWSSGSTYFYDCLFSKGGPTPSGLKSPPTKSPFSNPLPATPTPKPTARPQSGGSGSSTSGSATADPNASAFATAGTTESPSPDPQFAGALVAAASDSPGPDQAGAVRQFVGGSPSGGLPLPPLHVVKILAAVGGSGAALLGASYVLFFVRRRRRTGTG
jgi:hypothetical protein